MEGAVTNVTNTIIFLLSVFLFSGFLAGCGGAKDQSAVTTTMGQGASYETDPCKCLQFGGLQYIARFNP
jgi:predicted ABC-type sugar transport system permease subunit